MQDDQEDGHHDGGNMVDYATCVATDIDQTMKLSQQMMIHVTTALDVVVVVVVEGSDIDDEDDVDLRDGDVVAAGAPDASLNDKVEETEYTDVPWVPNMVRPWSLGRHLR